MSDMTEIVAAALRDAWNEMVEKHNAGEIVLEANQWGPIVSRYQAEAVLKVIRAEISEALK